MDKGFHSPRQSKGIGPDRPAAGRAQERELSLKEHGVIEITGPARPLQWETGPRALCPRELSRGERARLDKNLVPAILGSINALLTFVVADSLTRTQHNSDKELVDQGLGKLA
jgi:hypothetical protein